MLYVKNEAGELVPITYGGVFAKCPGCGVVHQVDISEIMEISGGDVEDANVYCEECSKRHLPLWERMDEVEFVASRFPGTSVEEVAKIVRSGLDHGFSFDTALVGARPGGTSPRRSGSCNSYTRAGTKGRCPQAVLRGRSTAPPRAGAAAGQRRPCLRAAASETPKPVTGAAGVLVSAPSISGKKR